MGFLEKISKYYHKPDIAFRGVFGSPLRGYKKVGKAFYSPDFLSYNFVVYSKSMV